MYKNRAVHEIIRQAFPVSLHLGGWRSPWRSWAVHWGRTAQLRAKGSVLAGRKLAKEQVFRWAIPNEPSSMDLSRYLYGGGDGFIFAWLMKFDPNYQVVPWLAERYEASPTGYVYTF